MTLDMGSSFTLKRHLPVDGKENNGLYIHESEKDALFAGDLKLVNDNNLIDATLTIGIEDYLLGVVAYEMSDSFPIEALKAQAVAARTYAIDAKRTSGSRSYDVVDTTQDQVYKGFDARYTNVVKAVSETSGIVGMANGKYAKCYYTASNGGQVASAKQIWGGSGAEYIEMKDDPYDLENPRSTVKSARIPYSPEYGSEIHRLIATALSEEMSALGMSDDVQDIRIDKIVSVTLADPDTKGSRMYKNMVFEVEISGKRIIGDNPEYLALFATGGEAAPLEATLMEATPAETEPEQDSWASGWGVQEATAAEATPEEPVIDVDPFLYSDFEKLEGTRKIKLATYGLVEQALKLSINTTNIEIFTIEETKSGYTVYSRRFGHGVGMSQRGAETMAGEYDKTYDEILKFYYPGMTLEQIDWTGANLTEIAALPDSVGLARARPTPRPTPAPLPPLQGSEYYARVKLETASSTLNVRGGPATSYGVVGLLNHNDRLIVVEPAEDGWFRIKTVELSGFVKGDYIEKE
ncbi:MAG: SpoIID/LytB domain-containing protein [Clostridia bacterium]|nr:SpoIID/LytB domain-containing protein [Clostridia bacterium]